MKTLVFVVAFTAAVSTAAESSAPDGMLLAAKVAIRQNEANHATELLERAIALRPASADLHYWLGSAYMAIGERSGVLTQVSMAKKMKAEMERAVRLDPGHVEARLNLVMFYAQAPGFMGGNDARALELASEAKRLDAFQGHRAFAMYYASRKELDLARKEYLDAIREEPDSARAHAALGTFLALRQKDFRAGWDELDKAVRLDPAYMPAWYRLGQVAAMSSANASRGEEALRKYLQYEPKAYEPEHYDAYYHLGRIYEAQGRKAEARASYESALRMRPGEEKFAAALKRVS